MVLLKWLQGVTQGLFATSERPIFLLFDENCNEPSNVICNYIAVLGGDVVRFCKNSEVSAGDFSLYDGVIRVFLKRKRVNVVFIKEKEGCKKSYKKSFSVQIFDI